MQPGVEESKNVELVGYHDIEGRPPFKIAIQNVGDEWYLYLGHFSVSGWSIVDVTDPANLEFLRFVESPIAVTTKQVQVADGLMITALERSAGEPEQPGTGALLWDVEADPTNPELVGHYKTGGRGTHRNFYNGGDYAFMCASPEGIEPTMDDPTIKPVKNFHLQIVDVSDPSTPQVVSKWMWPGQHPDDDSEATKNRYFHGPAYVSGDRKTAHLSYGRVGMVALDISDIEAPELKYQLGFGDGLGSYNGVHSFIPIPDTGLAVVNSEPGSEVSPLNREDGDPLQYTFIVDISDERDADWVGTRPQGPRPISVMPLPTPEEHVQYDNYYEKPGRFGPHNQHHPRGEACRLQTREHLFMAYFNAGLRIFDISDPTVPKEAGYFVPESPTKRVDGGRVRGELGTQFEDVVVDSRGYVYCTDPNWGVFVLKSEFA